MQANDSFFVHSLNATGSSMVQVGNNYNTTHHHYSGISDQDKAKIPAALCTTDPRHDKARIETTNGILLRDSYKWILDSPEFLSWRDDTPDSRLLWIRGDPGKGKTMLICGIIDELEASRPRHPEPSFLLSYFFCQATNSDLDNYTAVLRGLTYMLVSQQPSLLCHLDGKQEYTAAHWNSRVVMEEIFRNILATPALPEIYLIVDALDECLEDLAYFFEMISSTTSRTRWIVSSRNRDGIKEHLSRHPSKVAISLELNTEAVTQAVDYFISYRTRRLVELKGLSSEMAQKVHRHLSENSEGTFLWISLVCQQLEGCRAWEISDELLQFPQGLISLYKKMLAQIRSSRSSNLYLRLLATASTVFRPTTFPELIAMEDLQMNERMLQDVIVECGSFLTAKENTVFFIHQSAKDFLINESGPVLFQSGRAQHHYDLFKRSIIILQDLHKDLYGLVHIGITIEDAINRRPEPDPLRRVKYACIHWADHLQTACELEQNGELRQGSLLIKPAVDFIAKKFLFWLEALSLCQKSSVAAKVLVFIKNLPTARPQPESENSIEDALRFFRYFRYIIDKFPLQIYASGLLFSPENSFIRRQFKYYTSEIFLKLPEVDKDWNAVQTRYDHPYLDLHSTTKFLPGTQQLLTTSRRYGIAIWQIEDGTIHKTVQTDDVAWATASSDLKWLAVMIEKATGHSEPPAQHTLQLRDISSNQVVCNKEVNGKSVKRVEVSPDNRWLVVCYNTDLELYDVDLMKLEASTVEPTFALNHERIRKARGRISFSSDSVWMALDSSLVLNIQNGHWQKKHPPPKTQVGDAKFIPGTYTLASCSDGHIIHLWHVSKGVCEVWRLPHLVMSLGFPHSETWVVMDGVTCLYLYDLEQRKLIRCIDIPNQFCTQDIIVSQDNQTIIATSHKEVLVLDVHALLTQKSLPTSSIIPYEMSDDWQFSAHHLSDRLEIWNTNTGTRISELPFGRTAIDLFKFSTSGKDLAFTYRKPHPLLVSVWTSSHNNLRHYSGHDFTTNGLAISDDGGSEGHWLAAKSNDNVFVWDITTGERKTFIDISNDSLRELTQMAFVGTRLGVLYWSCRRERSSGYDFSLFDIRTREQVYTVSISMDADIFAPILRLSSNGKSGMVYGWSMECLSIWDSDGNIHYARFSNSEAGYFSFQDGITIYTQRGRFPIRSIIGKPADSEAQSSQVSLVHVGDEFNPRVVEPEFGGYGYINGEDWITLDNMPLLWLPVQYRPETFRKSACGHDYVVVQSRSGIYSIRFNKNARDLI